MTIDEMIAVLTAAKEGKQIERRRTSQDVWKPVPLGHYNFGDYEHRVKPEPREWWAEIYSGNGKWGRLCPTEKDARDTGHNYPIVHVREVIDDK